MSKKAQRAVKKAHIHLEALWREGERSFKHLLDDEQQRKTDWHLLSIGLILRNAVKDIKK